MVDTAAASQTLATRVITYAVAPGHETEFTAWAETINALTASFPGCLGIDLLPPNKGSAQPEWVSIYRFASSGQLRYWMDSPARSQALAAAPDIFVDRPEDFMMSGGSSVETGVTLVASHTVIPGREKEWAKGNAELNDAAAKFPGFMGVELLPATGDNPDSTTLIRFRSQAELDVWMASPERARLREELYKYVSSHHASVAGSGFGSWFAFNQVAGASSPAWKQSMAVVVGLFPTVMLLNLTLQKHIPGSGSWFPFNIWVGNVVGTILLAWVLMPIISRVFDWWLSPRCQRKNTVIGVVLMLVIYAVEIALITYIFDLVTTPK